MSQAGRGRRRDDAGRRRVGITDRSRPFGMACYAAPSVRQQTESGQWKRARRACGAAPAVQVGKAGEGGPAIGEGPPAGAVDAAEEVAAHFLLSHILSRVFGTTKESRAVLGPQTRDRHANARRPDSRGGDAHPAGRDRRPGGRSWRRRLVRRSQAGRARLPHPSRATRSISATGSGRKACSRPRSSSTTSTTSTSTRSPTGRRTSTTGPRTSSQAASRTPAATPPASSARSWRARAASSRRTSSGSRFPTSIPPTPPPASRSCGTSTTAPTTSETCAPSRSST